MNKRVTYDAEKLIERNRVGVLLRVFAVKPEDVELQVQSALRALQRLLALKTGERRTFARIDFLVSSDPEFNDSDCGQTAEHLRERARTEFPDAPINVFDIKKGDIYTMLLNYGVATQLEDRVSYSLILSHWAHEHITDENVHALFAAVYNKARVAGIAIPEIADTVREGRIANTFALWHNKSLMTVGGFDLRAGKPLKQDEPTVQRVEANDHSYHVAGAEEIIPLLRFQKFFGPSIKVVEPIHQNESVIGRFDEEWHTRHRAKLATKDARQRHMAGLVEMSIDSLKHALL